MNICTECLEYQIRNNLIKMEKCYKCGQMTFYWTKDAAGCFIMECSNCDAGIAVDMNTPCEMDSRLRKDIRLRIRAQEKEVSNIAILKLAKLFRLSALEMRKSIKEGYTSVFEPDKIEEVIQLLEQNDIDYIVKDLFEPKKEYGYYKECTYPYSSMRSFKK